MIEFTSLPTVLYGLSQAAMAVGTISLFAATVSASYMEQSNRVPPGHYQWLGEEAPAQQ